MQTCLSGHELNAQNLGLRKDGSRYCRKCNAERTRRWRARKLGRRIDWTPIPRAEWHPSEAMSETDWAYLAGLIDGEGCVGVYLRSKVHRGSRQKTSSPSYKILLNIVNSHRGVLEWVLCHLGGDIQPKSAAAGNHKPAWVWRQKRVDAAQFVLRKCLPYLKIKREQAELVLSFPGYQAINQWTPECADVREIKRELYRKTKMLNRRGAYNALDAE